jgi:hypothetical protein
MPPKNLSARRGKPFKGSPQEIAGGILAAGFPTVIRHNVVSIFPPAMNIQIKNHTACMKRATAVAEKDTQIAGLLRNLSGTCKNLLCFVSLFLCQSRTAR